MISSAGIAALAVAGAVLGWPSASGHDRLEPLSDRGRQGSAAARRGRSDGGRPRRLGRAAWSSGAEAGAIEREVITLVEGLAGALRAGLTPARALDQLARAAQVGDAGRATRLDGLVAQLAAQAAVGARLEPVLRTTARRLGSPALMALAGGWGMSERHGAPVVDVLDQLAAALRQAARSQAAIQAALAAPRATATLLGVLPFGGLVLGELVGVDPLGVLFGTPLGRVCLAGGLLLTWGGRVWMRRLVAGVEHG